MSILIILQWPFEASMALYLIHSSGRLIYFNSLFSLWTSPACWVSDCLIYAGSQTYVCIKFGFFLLLICFMSVYQTSQRRLEGEVCSSPIPLVLTFLQPHRPIVVTSSGHYVIPCLLTLSWYLGSHLLNSPQIIHLIVDNFLKFIDF